MPGCAPGVHCASRLRVVSVRDLSDRFEIAENRRCLAGVDDDVGSGMSDRLGVAADGQTSSFVAFYEEQYAPAVRLVRFLTGDRGIAEDLAQDAFVRVRDRFAQLENPGGYLRTTVVNVCRNHHRAARREELRLVRHGPVASEVSERAAELEATLLRLPYDERAVVVLRYWLGLSEGEIAEHLGCRPGTVKSRHARAVAKIRKELT